MINIITSCTHIRLDFVVLILRLPKDSAVGMTTVSQESFVLSGVSATVITRRHCLFLCFKRVIWEDLASLCGYYCSPERSCLSWCLLLSSQKTWSGYQRLKAACGNPIVTSFLFTLYAVFWSKISYCKYCWSCSFWLTDCPTEILSNSKSCCCALEWCIHMVLSASSGTKWDSSRYLHLIPLVRPIQLFDMLDSWMPLVRWLWALVCKAVMLIWHQWTAVNDITSFTGDKMRTSVEDWFRRAQEESFTQAQADTEQDSVGFAQNGRVSQRERIVLRTQWVCNSSVQACMIPVVKCPVPVAECPYRWARAISSGFHLNKVASVSS